MIVMLCILVYILMMMVTYQILKFQDGEDVSSRSVYKLMAIAWPLTIPFIIGVLVVYGFDMLFTFSDYLFKKIRRVRNFI